MITKLLENLNFLKTSDNIFKKQYQNHNNYEIVVDFNKSKIYYRNDNKTTIERVDDKKIQLGDLTTSYFKKENHPNTQENFVVLECVDRLLEKGYMPNDIHLERKWKLGHGASGGKADINIYGKDGKTLFIVQCKTWGSEFETEKAKMELHGGQLFTYLQQDQNAKYIALYASKFEKQTTYTNLIIKIEDRKEDLEKTKKEIEKENIKLYTDAKNKKEFFEVWKESFNFYFHFNGIFDSDVNAYSIKLKPLKRKDLKELDSSSGAFKKFAEILRHNNISDNANAFNRILSLFLCKIVDEEKGDDEVLEFQVKEDQPHEDIQDKLQHLYQKGMKEHLKENIIYYSEKNLQDIIDMYPKRTPLEKIAKMFKELKYYTNNEFAFKEVHNEELFKQNARVLNEVVKLLQNYRFKYSSKRQVLGDFFELMLNHGVKQSEGQFFTPIPIVRYIISSLNYPQFIENKIKNNEKEFLPKVLDYACGAGHFLTESIDEIQEILKAIDPKDIHKDLIQNLEDYKRSTKWAQQYIYGIEKDYRLARTSQISCFLNGDGDANILFGDGLEEHERLKLNHKKFDIVIANPPYAVKTFKNYLKVDEKQYSLYPFISEKSGEIETLFIERTKQVLNYDGLAGIVLPTSILNNSGTYQKTRELILKYFEIKGITELGNKTFIATSTSTVVLFLKRRDDDFYRDRNYIANDIFNQTKYSINIDFVDNDKLLDRFIAFREFDKKDYKNFLEKNINITLSKTDMFEDYKNTFDKQNDIKKLKLQKSFKELNKTKQDEKLTSLFYEYCKDIEKEKFLYFMLCIKQGKYRGDENYYNLQKTTVVNSGDDINKQEEFLGYKIIKKEGIKIVGENKMFNSKNIDDTTKANYYIGQSINDKNIKDIDKTLKTNIKQLDLVDMISFDNVVFDKQIKPNASKKIKFDTRWELIKISHCLVKNSGAVSKIEKSEYKKSGKIAIVSQESDELISGYTNLNIKPIVDLPLTIFGDHTTVVKYVDFPFIRGADGVVLLKANDSKFIQKAFYYIIKSLDISTGKYMRHNSILQDIKIPIPPKDIQQKLINDMEALEKKEQINEKKINKKQQDIKDKVNNVNDTKLDKLGNIVIKITDTIILQEKHDTINYIGLENIKSNTGELVGTIKANYNDIKSSKTIFKQGDLLYGKLRPNLNKVYLADFDGICSTDILVFRFNNKYLAKFYKYYFLDKKFNKQVLGSVSGLQLPRTTFGKMEHINIPFLPPEIQKDIIKEIETIENDIARLKKENDQIQTQKEIVLKIYL